MRAFDADARAGARSSPLLISLENGKSLADAAVRGGLRRRVLPLVRRGGRAPARRGRAARRAGPTASSSATSRSASACSSPRGTSLRRWPPARSHPRSPPAAPRSSSRPPRRRSPRSPWPRCCEEAGLPAGVVNVVTTSRPRPGRRGHARPTARTRKLSFTGSTEVGRLLLRTAADRVLKCADGARRQRPVRGARRRRPRRGARRRHGRQDAQRRPGLHRRQPVLRRRRRVHDAFVEGLVGPHGRRARSGPGTDESHPVRPAHQRRGRRARSTGSCATPSTGAPGRCWAVGPATGPAASTRRPCSSTFRRTPDPARGGLRPRGTGRPLRVARTRCCRWSTTPSTAWSATSTPRDLARGLRLAEGIESGMVGLNRGLVSDPAAPVRRHEAERPRPRGEHRGAPRVHGGPVHRDVLVTRRSAPPRRRITNQHHTAHHAAPPTHHPRCRKQENR